MSLVTRAEAQWEPSNEDSVPALAGFIISGFSPLAAEVAKRCLEQVKTTADTAVIIVSATGDLATAAATAQAVDNGRRPGPLLFYQAVPNAVAGYIAAKYGLTGPIICVAPQKSGVSEGLSVASLLIRDGEAQEALIIAIEQAVDTRQRDSAHAILVSGSAHI